MPGRTPEVSLDAAPRLPPRRRRPRLLRRYQPEDGGDDVVAGWLVVAASDADLTAVEPGTCFDSCDGVASPTHATRAIPLMTRETNVRVAFMDQT